MKTFEELKKDITPEFIKKLCELVEGFKIHKDPFRGNNIISIDFPLDSKMVSETDIINSLLFPLIPHRAVEGWNKQISETEPMSGIIIFPDLVQFWNNGHRIDYKFLNYQPCHLTRCEMAILDCLMEVLK